MKKPKMGAAMVGLRTLTLLAMSTIALAINKIQLAQKFLKKFARPHSRRKAALFTYATAASSSTRELASSVTTFLALGGGKN